MIEPIDWRKLNDPATWPVTRVGWLTDAQREIMRQWGLAEVKAQADAMQKRYDEAQQRES